MVRPIVAALLALALTAPAAGAQTLAVSPDGRIALAFNDGDRVRVALGSPAGGLGPAATVCTSQPGRWCGGLPAVGVADTGEALVAWKDLDTKPPQSPADSYTGDWAALISADGAVGPATALGCCGAPGEQVHVAMNAAGAGVVARDGWGPGAARDAGGPLLAASASSTGWAGVAMAPDGTAFAVSTPYQQRPVVSSRPPGGEFGPPQPFADGPAAGPVAGVAAGPDGTVEVAWTADGGPLMAAHRRPDGAWTQAAAVGPPLVAAALGLDRAGAAQIGFNGASGPEGEVPVVRRRPAGSGEYGPPVAVWPHRVYGSRIAFTPSGATVAAALLSRGRLAVTARGAAEQEFTAPREIALGEELLVGITGLSASDAGAAMTIDTSDQRTIRSRLVTFSGEATSIWPPYLERPVEPSRPPLPPGPPWLGVDRIRWSHGRVFLRARCNSEDGRRCRGRIRLLRHTVRVRLGADRRRRYSFARRRMPPRRATAVTVTLSPSGHVWQRVRMRLRIRRSGAAP